MPRTEDEPGGGWGPMESGYGKTGCLKVGQAQGQLQSSLNSTAPFEVVPSRSHTLYFFFPLSFFSFNFAFLSTFVPAFINCPLTVAFSRIVLALESKLHLIARNFFCL